MAYIRLAIVVLLASLIAGLFFWGYSNKKDADAAIASAATYKTQVDGLLTLNQQQAEANAALVNQRHLDDVAVTSLNAKLDTIQASTDAQADQLRELSDNDQTSKDWLKQPVPSGVIGVVRPRTGP